MIPKFIEIRDEATFIPALAFLIHGSDDYLARRAGFGETPCVFLVTLSTEHCSYDPYHWGDRTMQTAHVFLVDHWDEVVNGDVVDVEYILGESPTKKVSERTTAETHITPSDLIEHFKRLALGPASTSFDVKFDE